MSGSGFPPVQKGCWNCRLPGPAGNHNHRNCTAPRAKYCFGCGLPGQSKKDCPRTSCRERWARERGPSQHAPPSPHQDDPGGLACFQVRPLRTPKRLRVDEDSSLDSQAQDSSSSSSSSSASSSLASLSLLPEGGRTSTPVDRPTGPADRPQRETADTDETYGPLQYAATLERASEQLRHALEVFWAAQSCSLAPDRVVTIQVPSIIIEIRPPGEVTPRPDVVTAPPPTAPVAPIEKVNEEENGWDDDVIDADIAPEISSLFD